MKHLVTPCSLPLKNNNDTSPTCKGLTQSRTTLEARRFMESCLLLFNILYELYVTTMAQINYSPLLLEEDCNVAGP